MSRVAMTGGDGFLGWHTQCALRESGTDAADIPVGGFFDETQAAGAIEASSRFIHLAGVNRGSDDEVETGNVLFAQQVADVIRQVDNPPKTIVYSNSIQATLDNVYGRAKARAADILGAAASAVGADFLDVRFPNLFGEHGRPFYNAVTATFCHLLAEGDQPTVQVDKELMLLHAQDAADILIGERSQDNMPDLTVQESVSGLLRRLTSLAKNYREGEIPDIADRFDRNLFNTYRSYLVTQPIILKQQADRRGGFVEMIRNQGGPGQSSFSTTRPGIVRGNHFHRRKVERFVVVSGQARITLRKLLTDKVMVFDVDGESPIAIDMPTMWAHNITNIGLNTLFTVFWANDLFDPNRPDTIPEVV